MNGAIMWAFLAVFFGASVRTGLGWLKSGGPFDFGKFLRTLLIAFLVALIILGTKVLTTEPLKLFFSVLTLTYAVDDIKNLKKTPKIYEETK